MGALRGASSTSGQSSSDSQLALWVGHTRFVVLLAVFAVLLVAVALFLAASWLAVTGIWDVGRDTVRGELDATKVTVEFLEVISAMLKAVIFYLVGIGLYSLFIGPLNLTTALGVETLAELERKVVSIVILIMAVTLLEHFIQWEDPENTLRFGATLALVVIALVAFQLASQRSDRELYTPSKEAQVRAQRELYEEHREERRVTPEEVAAAASEQATRPQTGEPG
jgi:uncharacterized membrane protein YqhA